MGDGSTSSTATFATSACSSGEGIALRWGLPSLGQQRLERGLHVSLPSGVEANDQIIVTVTTLGGSSPSTPAGYTVVSTTHLRTPG